MNIVEVTWLDARHQFGPVSKTEIEAGAAMKTLGYLISHDKDFVVIAMEYWPDDDVYRNVSSIPASLVKDVRTL